MRRSLSSLSQTRAHACWTALLAGVDAPAGEGAEGGVGAGHEDGAAVVEERKGLLDGEQGAAGVEVERGVEVGLGDLAERGGLAPACAGPQHVEASLLPLDGVVQAVQVVQVGGVALDAGDVAADLLHGLVQGVLAAAGDEDVRSLLDEQLRACQRHAGGAAGDDRDLAVKLSHSHSLGSVVPCAPGMTVLCTPPCVLTVRGGRLGRKLCTPVVT